MEEKVEVKDALCQNILANSPHGIIYYDHTGTILFCNDCLLEMLKVSGNDIVGNSISKIFMKDMEDMITSTLLGNKTVINLDYQLALSKKIRLQIKSVPFQLKEEVKGGLLFVEDTTLYKELQDRVQEMANYDYLTQLPNRKLFNEQFKATLNYAHIQQEKVALFFLDLDRFKTINDISGFEIGDQVLKKVGERIATMTESSFGVTRFGGDTFALIKNNIDSVDSIKRIATRMLDLFKDPICIDSQKLQLTVSIGISIFPDDGDNESHLLKGADIALSQAKKAGRNNYKFYSESVAKNSIDRLIIERNLRKALINNQFKLHYQPQIKFSTGEIIGIEALIRWKHDGKIISPIEFIPIAEETGLIHSIGEWVLKEACQQNKRWQEEGFPKVPIAVNLSIAQVQQPNFVDIVSHTLEVTGLEARYLELELTESMFIHNMDTMVSILRRLKDLGVHLVLDDFGTGYSSFSYLRHLFIDTLKIDRSFVQNIPKQPNDGLISTAIINLAKSLDIHVIAEGVETEEQVQFLLNNSCDNMQGFLFSQPLSTDDMKNFLLQRKHVKQIKQ